MTIVGIHTPEFDTEKDVDAIRKKAQDNNLHFPIAADNRSSNWKAWKNQCWPCIYLVDKRGTIRYRWDGELNFGSTKGEDIMRKRIEGMMAEAM